MQIAIIGAGNVGSVLARRFQEVGHSVSLGVRNSDDPKYHELQESGFALLPIATAASAAEVVVLATPWDATEAAVQACGDLHGKNLIDCTNPLQPQLAGLTHAGDDSGGEQVKRWAPGAHVAKAFNTIGANIMANPTLEGRRAVLYVCGDEPAHAVAMRLGEAIGFETVDSGPLEGARLLEPFAMLWISSAYKLGFGRDFAFSIVRRSTTP